MPAAQSNIAYTLPANQKIMVNPINLQLPPNVQGYKIVYANQTSSPNPVNIRFPNTPAATSDVAQSSGRALNALSIQDNRVIAPAKIDPHGVRFDRVIGGHE
eukprot:PhF_6_TR29000/c0_g1_i1/m.42257